MAVFNLPWIGNNKAAVARAAADPASVWPLIYATETGVAEDLAHDTRALLAEAGVPARLVPMDTLELSALQTMPRALFLSSTTGQGDPPDMAWAFHEECMQQPAELSGLAYGLLGLGDSCYPDFCQFPRQLDQWLRDSGAQPLFDMIVVDDEDDAALARWRHEVGQLAATKAVVTGTAPG